jgi:hypothetical protein
MVVQVSSDARLAKAFTRPPVCPSLVMSCFMGISTPSDSTTNVSTYPIKFSELGIRNMCLLSSLAAIGKEAKCPRTEQNRKGWDWRA